MILDAAEMRRRWSDKTNATFSRDDFQKELVYGPENHELEVDFEGCESIVFMDGDSTRGEDLLMMAKGTGHMSVPAGVQLRVVAGKVKIMAAANRGPGSSVVGSSYGSGNQAPPPTRVSGYAESSANSGYESGTTFQPSPPRNQAGFRQAGSHVGSYVSAAHVPLPKSVAGTRGQADWDDGRSSVGPGDSISCVGRRD